MRSVFVFEQPNNMPKNHRIWVITQLTVMLIGVITNMNGFYSIALWMTNFRQSLPIIYNENLWKIGKNLLTSTNLIVSIVWSTNSFFYDVVSFVFSFLISVITEDIDVKTRPSASQITCSKSFFREYFFVVSAEFFFFLQ